MAHAMTSSGLPAFTQHSFARVPNVNKPRSTFDRSKPYKTTLQAGIYTPVHLDEILPGDSFKVDASMFARLLSPLSVPIMDNMYIDWIAIYCPNRLLWNHFVNQMGELENPDDTTDYLTPVVTVPDGGFTLGSMADFFGLPLGVGGADSAVPMTVCAYPFRMYNLFIKQWVIAQNVVDGPTINNGDGPDPLSDYVLWNRMKRPDYFTSGQPATQKGSPVELPIGGSAPVVFPSNAGAVITDDGTWPLGTGVPAVDGAPLFALDSAAAEHTDASIKMPVDAYANLATVTGVTINEFRLLATTQQFLELDERGGSRFPEFLYNHFGVTSSDARLQRVEFIAAGTIPIMTHVVPQTSGTDTTAQANLAAFTSAFGQCSFTHSFEEHGWLMVLVEIRADMTYYQGEHKMFTRQTKFDYYDPIFANIGEQAILNNEIYTQGTSADSEPFGFQEYAAEYRFGLGQVTNLMRPGVTGSIAVYNLTQQFGSLPTLSGGLGGGFLNDSPPISRIVAVEDEPDFIFDSFWKVECTRVMPTFSIPGISRV